MKVKELLEKLRECNPEDTVAIYTETPHEWCTEFEILNDRIPLLGVSYVVLRAAAAEPPRLEAPGSAPSEAEYMILDMPLLHSKKCCTMLFGVDAAVLQGAEEAKAKGIPYHYRFYNPSLQNFCLDVVTGFKAQFKVGDWFLEEITRSIDSEGRLQYALKWVSVL